MKWKEIREGLCPGQPAGSVAAGLQDLADPVYQAFFARLVPEGEVLGVKMPALRTWAKGLSEEERQSFMTHLPHRYVEENQAHVLMINEMREFGAAADALRRFAPFADNWAVTDTIRIRALRRAGADADAQILLNQMERWMQASATYTVRYAVVELMTDFLDSRFDAAHLHLVGDISSSEYYVNMARAWYFATALAKQWESVLPVLQKRILDPWTHNKTIQKACESYRVTPEHKALLRSLRV